MTWDVTPRLRCDRRGINPLTHGTAFLKGKTLYLI